METRIEKIIYEGWGLGQDEKSGRKIFIKKSVPGDLVNYVVTKDKNSYSEGEIVEVKENSPIRQIAPCPYFEKCGGCDHQNIAYENQLDIKAKVFAESLSRAKIELKPDKIFAGSASEFFYRNVMRFFLDLDQNGELQFYMHHFNYQKGKVKINDCLLLSEESHKIIDAFRTFVNENIKNKSSFWQFRIRHAKKADQYMVEIITSARTIPDEQGIVHALLRQSEKIVSIYHSYSENKDLRNQTRRLLFGTTTIQEKVGFLKFQISPESFFQTNSLGVETLYEKIKELADIKMGESLLDLYCGTGTIGIYLSTKAKEIIGVETVQSAINDAKDNAKINHIKNCTFFCQDANDYLRKTDKKFDVIIVDPPRNGLDKLLINRLGLIDFGRLIYVSCNPATFARDINLLHDKNIELIKVQPVDMFPQTHHIECIGLLQKDPSADNR